jgi:hypothetical protein
VQKYKVAGGAWYPERQGSFDVEVYLASEVDTDRDRSYQALRAAGTEMVRLNQRVGELEEEVQNLQRALFFWLPHVPAEDTERSKRIGDDTYLLIGYQGEIEKCAQELGWISLSELMVERMSIEPIAVVYHPIQMGVTHRFFLRHLDLDGATFVECQCGWRREVPNDFRYEFRMGDEPTQGKKVEQQ